MNVSIISHCAMDTVHIGDSVYEQAGGDACYSGLMSKEFRANVTIQTRFGDDFPKRYLEGINIRDDLAVSTLPTTRFRIVIDGLNRTLYLQNQCEEIQAYRESQDGLIVSPIYHEVTPAIIKKQDGYILYNPQGLLRTAGSDGTISITDNTLDMAGVDALKVNPAEIRTITGEDDSIYGMKRLQKMGARIVICTNGKEIMMLEKTMLYTIELPNKEIFDTTGLGAILCGAFLHTILKERDALWALCFAGGSIQAALDTKAIGLSKIPKKGAIQSNASYFYNLVKYKQV
ncbi:MAG: ribokinase [Cenarchaeum sp. SB0662_bin_33]|nr:ribokinase [Cenarchaeum sp. SB0664_bin_35]MYB46416.1 ribokinase [Cenarchaeum sp. SB0662_bin_33]